MSAELAIAVSNEGIAARDRRPVGYRYYSRAVQAVLWAHRPPSASVAPAGFDVIYSDGTEEKSSTRAVP